MLLNLGVLFQTIIGIKEEACEELGVEAGNRLGVRMQAGTGQHVHGSQVSGHQDGFSGPCSLAFFFLAVLGIVLCLNLF